MSPTLTASLRAVRRGDDPNELQLVTTDGVVVILLGYGLTVDEGMRSREAALRLIRDALAPDLIAEHEARRH
jgi:hypothetical protein